MADLLSCQVYCDAFCGFTVKAFYNVKLHWLERRVKPVHHLQDDIPAQVVNVRGRVDTHAVFSRMHTLYLTYSVRFLCMPCSLDPIYVIVIFLCLSSFVTRAETLSLTLSDSAL